MNYLVKCTRCRHNHGEASRVDVRDKKERGVFHQVCPKCGCRSYYNLKADGKIARFSERDQWALAPKESEVSP